MASFLTSIKRELNDDSEEVSESQDSFFRRDFDKLKEMLTNLKENKPKAEKNASFEDMTLSSETKGNLNRLITKERGMSEDYTDEARREKQHYEEEIANLRNKLEISETRLAKLQDFNSSLFKKLTTSENELKKCQEILSKREYLNQVKSLEIEDMNHKITSLSLANQAELEKLKQSYEILKKEMYEKQYEAIKFEQIIKDKDNQIRQLSEQLPEYTLEELENILKENKILREKITETEKSIDNLYMFKSNDSAILLEMDKLKSDIKRLIDLLKSTDEFKEFAENAKLLNNDVRFLKNVHKEKGTNKNFKQWSEKRNLKSEFENYFWVPTDAFKFANDFRVKYQGHFTEELIESLLFEINKLWKDKHEKSLSKLKEKYELKLANLRQQYTSSNIQSSIVNQKMISRLKNQVQKSSKDLETLKKNKKIDGLEALNTTLKVATREHHRLKSLEMENKKLSSQLQSMVDSTVLSKHAKPEFIEGATWIYGKIKKELDGLIEICSDLIQDYEAKLQQILTEFPEREETNMILARSKWLIDGVETTLSSFYETVKNLEGQIVLPYATIGDYTSVNSILTKDYHS